MEAMEREEIALLGQQYLGPSSEPGLEQSAGNSTQVSIVNDKNLSYQLCSEAIAWNQACPL